MRRCSCTCTRRSRSTAAAVVLVLESTVDLVDLQLYMYSTVLVQCVVLAGLVENNMSVLVLYGTAVRTTATQLFEYMYIYMY